MNMITLAFIKAVWNFLLESIFDATDEKNFFHFRYNVKKKLILMVFIGLVIVTGVSLIITFELLTLYYTRSMELNELRIQCNL